MTYAVIIEKAFFAKIATLNDFVISLMFALTCTFMSSNKKNRQKKNVIEMKILP